MARAGGAILTMATFVLTLAVAGVLLVAKTGAELTQVEHTPKSEGSLAILAVGDWGRRGQFNQTLVAEQMGVVGEKLDVDFVISTGDNFYDDGIANTSDPLFKESFTNVYTADGLQKPWYIVLGNHDYTGNALAQQDPAIREVDSRYNSVNKSFIVSAGIADFFLVDTSPFIQKYWNNSKYDWRQVAPLSTYVENLVQDLDSALTESTASWKIVVGHHPISSGCEHGNTTELRQLLLPVLEEHISEIDVDCFFMEIQTHGVDIYLNGHDHCLQRITGADSSLQLLTSGGGSKAWAGKFKATSDKLEFLYDGQGFMSMQLSETDAQLAFYDVTGAVLHSWGINKTASADGR